MSLENLSPNMSLSVGATCLLLFVNWGPSDKGWSKSWWVICFSILGILGIDFSLSQNTFKLFIVCETLLAGRNRRNTAQTVSRVRPQLCLWESVTGNSQRNSGTYQSWVKRDEPLYIKSFWRYHSTHAHHFTSRIALLVNALKVSITSQNNTIDVLPSIIKLDVTHTPPSQVSSGLKHSWQHHSLCLNL